MNKEVEVNKMTKVDKPTKTNNVNNVDKNIKKNKKKKSTKAQKEEKRKKFFMKEIKQLVQLVNNILENINKVKKLGAVDKTTTTSIFKQKYKDFFNKFKNTCRYLIDNNKTFDFNTFGLYCTDLFDELKENKCKFNKDGIEQYYLFLTNLMGEYNTYKTSQEQKFMKDNATGEKTMEEIVKIAINIWKKTKEYKLREDFQKMTNDEKIKFFKETHKDFYTEFPIVSRYMLIHEQFSPKALKKMLKKVKFMNDHTPENRPKDWKEDEWVKRRADYVQFLWQAYHPRQRLEIAKRVWTSTYHALKKEFTDFREKVDDVEKTVEENKKRYVAEKAKDILHEKRLNQMSIKEKLKLYLLLENKKIRKMMRNVMFELRTTVSKVKATCSGVGTGKETGKEGQIQMYGSDGYQYTREISRDVNPDNKSN